MDKNCPNCFKMVSARTRIKIIEHLRIKPRNVNQIGEFFKLSQPTISYHLNNLERMGIVVSKKEGRETFYSINKKYPCKKCFLLHMPFKT
jgi:ArsR family transcriptional regulator